MQSRYPLNYKFEITLVENPVELWITQLNPGLIKVRASRVIPRIVVDNSPNLGKTVGNSCLPPLPGVLPKEGEANPGHGT